jgi:hypothetical protein
MRNRQKQIVWYSAGGGFLRIGPFGSQATAWKAMILTAKEQHIQKSIHPKDTHVWCEEINHVE